MYVMACQGTGAGTVGGERRRVLVRRGRGRVRVHVRKTPPSLQITAYYHASNFTEFGNVSTTTHVPQSALQSTLHLTQQRIEP